MQVVPLPLHKSDDVYNLVRIIIKNYMDGRQIKSLLLLAIGMKHRSPENRRHGNSAGPGSFGLVLVPHLHLHESISSQFLPLYTPHELSDLGYIGRYGHAISSLSFWRTYLWLLELQDSSGDHPFHDLSSMFHWLYSSSIGILILS